MYVLGSLSSLGQPRVWVGDRQRGVGSTPIGRWCGVASLWRGLLVRDANSWCASVSSSLRRLLNPLLWETQFSYSSATESCPTYFPDWATRVSAYTDWIVPRLIY